MTIFLHTITKRSAALFVLAGLLIAGDPAAAAATLKITAIVLNVTYQPGPKESWRKCALGTQLSEGSRVRTASRSKCEIKFPDGSLVRMAPRSDLVVTSVAGKKLKLVSGQVLANVVGTSRLQIEGATATAGVRGTWVLFDGDEMSAWEGTATLTTSAGTMTLVDGEQARATSTRVALLVEHNISAGAVTVGIEGENLIVTYETKNGWELLGTSLYAATEPPSSSAPELFSYRHEGLAGVAMDQHSISLLDIGVEPEDIVYLAAHAALSRAPFDQVLDGWGEGVPFDEDSGMYFVFEHLVKADTWPFTFPTGEQQPWWYGLRAGVSTQSTPGTSVGTDFKRQADLIARAIGPTTGAIEVIVHGAGSAAVSSSGGAAGLMLAAAPQALASLSQSQPAAAFGRNFYGPRSRLDVYGLLGNGHSFGGMRARASGVWGNNLYLEVGGQINSDLSEEWHTTVSEGFGLWRAGEFDIIAGRQHYLQGPVSNCSLGSLFSYTTFDGARLRYNGRNATVDLAWIDSYDRVIIEGGEGGGVLGRLSLPRYGGQIGFNYFHEQGVGDGASVDVSYPVRPGYLDFYAEVGEDAADNKLTTCGFYFPNMYQTLGLDLFVEYAERDGYDPMWSAVGYQEMDKGWTGVFSARRIQGGDWDGAIGAFKRFGSLD